LPGTAEASRQAHKEGDAHLKAGRAEQALAAFEQAIQLDSSNARAYSGKGDALSKLKRYEESLEAFDQAIARDPSNAASYGSKGVVLFHLKRYEEALSSFDAGIQRDPNDAVTYNNKGTVLRTLQRYQEALAAFNLAIEQATRLNTSAVSAYNGKGHVLKALGRVGEAQAAFDQASRLDAAAKGLGAGAAGATPALASRPASAPGRPFASSNIGLSAGSIISLIGGALCVLAFFLPFASSGFVSFSLASLSSESILVWVEPLTGACFIFFALRAGSMGREAHTVNIVLGVQGVLGFLYFLSLIGSISLLAIGFWLAGAGFVVSLVGAIKGRSDLA
jgi:tetratricopeptide (TPR) repeat protein